MCPVPSPLAFWSCNSHSEECETRKAFFFGYVIHRLLLAALERRYLDDRDHYANKRLDLAGTNSQSILFCFILCCFVLSLCRVVDSITGPLLSGLFRQLFKKVTKDARLFLKKAVDQGRVHFSPSLSLSLSLRALVSPHTGAGVQPDDGHSAEDDHERPQILSGHGELGH